MPTEPSYTWSYANGRRYASQDLGHYYMPADEPEIQRLNEQHWMLTQTKNGALHSAPFAPTNAAGDGSGLKVLDVGCGSGIWCIQMAAEYPGAQVVGMDVSPIQPTNKPANVDWLVQDMEEQSWPFPQEHFDMVHLSLVHGCVADWDKFMRKMLSFVRPGGWLEHQEYSLCRLYLLDESGGRVPLPEKIEELPPILRWGRLMEKAAEKRGRALQLGPLLKDFHRDAGLQRVSEDIYPMPCGTWPSDPKKRELGTHFLLQTLGGVEGYSMIMFTKALGWSVEDTNAYLEEVRRDARDDSMRKVLDFHVVYSQKPGGD
ncbi:hypothetical protein MBLNU230_g7457t1 [Neophaeotheca triangularis]